MALRWRDVDLAQGVARLERHKGDAGEGRDILLSPEVTAALAALPRIKSSPYVFPSPQSATGHVTIIAPAWRDAWTKAGLRRIRPYDLRHSFASAAVGQGVSLYVTGKLLGHRNQATSQRYAHVERATTQAALERVAAVLRPAPPEAKP